MRRPPAAAQQRRTSPGAERVHLYAVGQHQIRPAATGSQHGAPVRQLSDPPPLNVDDMTILCGWARLAGPRSASTSLHPLPRTMDDVVSSTAATSDHLDAILAAVSADSASDEDELTGLVRRVLLAALELREAWHRHEEDYRAR
jgi:hypothetical protein